MALVDVNAREDILPGYTLVLHWKDSGVGVAGIEALRPPVVANHYCSMRTVPSRTGRTRYVRTALQRTHKDHAVEWLQSCRDNRRRSCQHVELTCGRVATNAFMPTEFPIAYS